MLDPSQWCTAEKGIIRSLSVRDVRFPTSRTKLWTMCHEGDCECGDKSDDYSCAYVIVYSDLGIKGFGMTFTLGIGTDLVCEAVKHLSPVLVGRKLNEIFSDFGAFWKELAEQSHLSWLGPQKGVVHMALSAMVNALWDLWGRLYNKPVWKLLVDMDPETLVSTIDFTYIKDTLTPEDCINMLKDHQEGKDAREKEIIQSGYPAYTSRAGAECLSDSNMSSLLKHLEHKGFSRFKLKIGDNLENNRRRCETFRKQMGWDCSLILDFNQRFNSSEAIEVAKALVEYKPLCIEEPTSADDVYGHMKVHEALKPYGVMIATGEHCYNRVIFKQFMLNDAADCYQVDPSRVGGLNEILAIVFMAKKFDKVIVPHTGGIAMCQLAQHIAIFDYIAFGGSIQKRMMEYVKILRDHFVFPFHCRKGHFLPPLNPGFSGELIEQSAKDYEYPLGRKWKDLFSNNDYHNPFKDAPLYIRRSRSYFEMN